MLLGLSPFLLFSAALQLISGFADKLYKLFFAHLRNVYRCLRAIGLRRLLLGALLLSGPSPGPRPHPLSLHPPRLPVSPVSFAFYEGRYVIVGLQDRYLALLGALTMTVWLTPALSALVMVAIQ